MYISDWPDHLSRISWYQSRKSLIRGLFAGRLFAVAHSVSVGFASVRAFSSSFSSSSSSSILSAMRLGNVGLACLYFLRGSLLSTCGRSEIALRRPFCHDFARPLQSSVIDVSFEFPPRHDLVRPLVYLAAPGCSEEGPPFRAGRVFSRKYINQDNLCQK